ncbi:hypothetical protein ACPXCO_37940 [Streptomyces cyaneofuscatus]|uniref:hypothetical protein n=1 Tax=Streptomyces TaxID=1883 RepID=UPI000978D31B|nr:MULTISPECIES: hypothetical protein [unclassified Streptomyces]CAD5911616.1 protein of unknown function [Streptomyces sp. KY75]CAD5995059.1 protein of unknown function [Streptomyces sp. KY70]
MAAYPGQHDERDREQLLALDAVELAYARRGEGRSATAEDVQRIALREFGLLIDITHARVTALRARRNRPGYRGLERCDHHDAACHSGQRPHRTAASRSAG